jgi:hypothetical protein
MVANFFCQLYYNAWYLNKNAKSLADGQSLGLTLALYLASVLALYLASVLALYLASALERDQQRCIVGLGVYINCPERKVYCRHGISMRQHHFAGTGVTFELQEFRK